MNNFDDLINAVAIIAREQFDGHFTILGFTTGFKVMFGTPDVARYELVGLKQYSSLKDALRELIDENISN